MSNITDGLYERSPIMHPHADVMKLLAHARALEAMLRKLEWSGWDSEYYRKQLCPECGAWNEDPSGHSPDCALAKLLD